MEGEEKTGANFRSRSSSSAPHVPLPRMMPLSLSVKRQWSRHWMVVCSGRAVPSREMEKNVQVTQQVVQGIHTTSSSKKQTQSVFETRGGRGAGRSSRQIRFLSRPPLAPRSTDGVCCPGLITIADAFDL